MSPPKPHIKPKGDLYRQQAEPPQRDAPPNGEWDPPVFTERDSDPEKKADDGVLFHEDDCLR
jgi:hypothetical protein